MGNKQTKEVNDVTSADVRLLIGERVKFICSAGMSSSADIGGGEHAMGGGNIVQIHSWGSSPYWQIQYLEPGSDEEVVFRLSGYVKLSKLGYKFTKNGIDSIDYVGIIGVVEELEFTNSEPLIIPGSIWGEYRYPMYVMKININGDTYVFTSPIKFFRHTSNFSIPDSYSITESPNYGEEY